MNGIGRVALNTLREAAVLQNRLTDALQDSGLTVDRWRCLVHVAAHPDASMSDLVEALVLAPATATRVVDVLVEAGLLYRQADPADRRRVVLRASAGGAELLDRVAPAVGAAESAVVAVG